MFFGQTIMLSSLIKYDPTSKRVTTLTPPSFANSFFGMTYCDRVDSLFAIRLLSSPELIQVNKSNGRISHVAFIPSIDYPGEDWNGKAVSIALLLILSVQEHIQGICVEDTFIVPVTNGSLAIVNIHTGDVKYLPLVGFGQNVIEGLQFDRNSGLAYGVQFFPGKFEQPACPNQPFNWPGQIIGHQHVKTCRMLKLSLNILFNL